MVNKQQREKLMTIEATALGRTEEQLEVARVLSLRRNATAAYTSTKEAPPNGSRPRQTAKQIQSIPNVKRSHLTEATRVQVTVELIDDQTREFSFEISPDARLRFGQRLKDFLAQSSIAFQLPDRMLVIPTSQIKSLNFTPRPDIAPEGVFANAQEILRQDVVRVSAQ
jgi:hypothetical protein